MTSFEYVRYYMALLVVAFVPGAFLFWFVVHPFVPFWRRVGYGWAYTLGLTVVTGVAVTLFAMRDALLTVEFGTSAVTVAVGAPLIVSSSVLRRKWGKHLRLRTLWGLPELAPERHESRLLSDGIYARVRHPRYLEMLLGVAGWAFVSNYLAAYAVTVYTMVMLALLIPLEERELVQRFGPAYEDYRRRVPALLPRLRRRVY